MILLLTLFCSIIQLLLKCLQESYLRVTDRKTKKTTTLPENIPAINYLPACATYSFLRPAFRVASQLESQAQNLLLFGRKSSSLGINGTYKVGGIKLFNFSVWYDFFGKRSNVRCAVFWELNISRQSSYISTFSCEWICSNKIVAYNSFFLREKRHEKRGNNKCHI